MIKEDNEWHLVWDSSVIYPEYQPMDVVKNSYASALRGDILDIYGLDINPVRIEFFVQLN